MSNFRRTVFIAVIAFAAAVAGVFVARSWVDPDQHQETELHALMHDGLDLDANQRARLTVLEKQFAIRKKALELNMRADNARLAAAIEAEHGFGPQVSEAIDRLHMVMGELQKETVAHVFAMRELLRPDQAAKFDNAVVKALTAEKK